MCRSGHPQLRTPHTILHGTTVSTFTEHGFGIVGGLST
jgi:hypothetical protein